ncbi:MAG: Fe-S cluster assembly protein SufD, partial [Arcanobacterium sp.]|nr:Fe-S cluster assembly protein SufD [Arcanobacterium sp.]
MGLETKVPVQSRAQRLQSFKLADFAVPTGTEEEWRFTPLERITDFFADTASGAPLAVTVTGEAQYEQVAKDDARLGQILQPDDRVSALAWEASETAHVVTIAQEAELSEEVVVDVRGGGEAAVSALQLLIDAKPFSKSTVIVNHSGN